MYMRAFAAAWTEEEIVQQAVGQTPWGYNIVLLDKQDAKELRLAYAGRWRGSPRGTSGGQVLGPRLFYLFRGQCT